MSVTVRPRTTADLPALVEALAEQQARSRYPLRWPLPFPVEHFLVRPTEEGSWVAESAGKVVGHVTVGRVDPGPAADVFVKELGAAGPEVLASVSVLFVAVAARGSGVGGFLLDTAVDWIERRGRTPVLDVVPIHGRAVAIYRHRGWHEVGRIRPDWLPKHEDDVLLMALVR